MLPIARQQALVADTLDLGPATWLPLAHGSTSAVYRVPEHRLVFRFSAPHQTALHAAHLRRASALVAAGVPFVFPAIDEPVTLTDPDLDDSSLGLVTVWHDLGDGSAIDYEQFGHTLRLLHDDGTKTLADDQDLGAVSDFDLMVMRLDKAAQRGLITPAEHDLLSSWVNRMEDLHPGHPTDDSDDIVLVHDDVWPKNVIQTPHGAHLVDPDNLAWGTREHDLSFISRAQDNATISLNEMVQFETGYGQQVPSPNDAWSYAYVHRMQWVLGLIETSDHPEPARQLRIELPLWSLPRGPRDDPEADRGVAGIAR